MCIRDWSSDVCSSELKALIEEGYVSSGGRPVLSPAAKVKTDQTFAIIVPEARPVALEGQAIPLDILYADRDLIVLDKPAGLVVHPAAGNPARTLHRERVGLVKRVYVRVDQGGRRQVKKKKNIK